MLALAELDETTRQHMLREFRAEQSNTDIGPYRPRAYIGRDDFFVRAMERALSEGDEISLMEDLTDPSLWDEYSVRPGKRRLVEYTDRYDVQAKRFAITDFNTWYVRGLAARLIEERVDRCEIYRADAAYQPRNECRRLEGLQLSVSQVYEGHRIRYHAVRVDRRALSIPVGPNCHHSIRRINGDEGS